ncbi:MAG: serine hydrolase [Rhizobiaceae bacterium]|nr:serine hydrolase [Rhizobiaceae bacterium]
MRIVARILAWFGLGVVVLAAGAAGWLYVFPPELLRVGTAYAAKIVCSNTFMAGRDPVEVLASDVQAPGHPLLRHVSVEKGRDRITARLFGFVAVQTALYRPGLGCAAVPDGDIDAARAIVLDDVPAPAKSDLEWPLGDQVSKPLSEPVQALLDDPGLAGPDMRAIVVVKDGRIVGERYGDGFGEDVPLMGWSMTKTVTAALAGLRVADGKLAYDQDKLFPEWTDDRARITVSDLMSMQSGLDLEEAYGDVNDVTRMLFLEPDQARFVESKPLEAEPGRKFEYTTGSAVLLSRVWMNTFADRKAALAYPRKALFGPLGMSSAVMEVDESGTFSGGSMMYATARDWVRFGMVLANGGVWDDVQLLPPEFIQRVSTPTTVSDGVYTAGMAWKRGGGERRGGTFELPADTYWALGHDGQSMAIVPSEHLVVLRLGLTPARAGYQPEGLLEKVVVAAREPAPDPELQPRIPPEE